MYSKTLSDPAAATPPSPTVSRYHSSLDQNGIELDQVPEGGRTAWCAVLGGMLVQFCGFGYSTSFGVYQAYYTLHHLTNESPSAISWIGSINAFLACAVSFVAGMLYDRGYFYHLLIGGALLQSFSLFMLSLAQQGQYYQAFLAQGIGFGLAQGLVYVPSIAVISHHFRRRRTLAMSLVTSGSSLGSIVHPIMLNYLFNRGVGFANGVRISATLVSILLLVACVLIRTRLEPPKRPVDHLTVGKGIIRDLPFCLMSFGYICFQMAFYFPIFYLQLDSIQHGNSELFSFYSLTIMNAMSFIGRLLSGFLAFQSSTSNLVIMATASCGIAILGMIGLNGIPSVVVLGALNGFFSGVYIALFPSLIGLLTNNFSEFGARIGAGMLIGSIGGLIGGPISGALLTSRYEWWRPSLFNGIMGLLGCCFLVMMEFVRRRRCLTDLEKQVVNTECK